MKEIITVLMTPAEIAHDTHRLPGETPGKGGLWIVEKDGVYYNDSTAEHVQWATSPDLASSFERRYWAERIAARFGGVVVDYSHTIPKRGRGNPGKKELALKVGDRITLRVTAQDIAALEMLAEECPTLNQTGLVQEALRRTRTP